MRGNDSFEIGFQFTSCNHLSVPLSVDVSFCKIPLDVLTGVGIAGSGVGIGVGTTVALGVAV